MKPLDKKQIPQVAALAVLALGLFAYFAKALLFSGTASAKVPAPAAPVAATAAAAAPGTTPGSAAAADTPAAPAATLRDPFAPAVSTTPAAATMGRPMAPPPAPSAPAAAFGPRLASLRALPPAGLSVPAAPALPFPAPFAQAAPRAGSAVQRPQNMLPPLPVAPLWTVTGVLQSGAEHVAILRSGDTRRFVKQGDFVDGEYKVAKVTRSFVVLRRGAASFMLPLGGSKPSSATAAAFAVPASAPAAARPLPGSAPALPMFAPATPPLFHVPTQAEPQDISRAAPAAKTTPAARPAAVATAALNAWPVHQAHAATVKVADARQGWHRPVEAMLPAAKAPAAHAVRALKPHAAAPARTPAPYTLLTNADSETPLGTLAPDFSLPTLGGPRFSLSDLHGRVVVLHFWASWMPGAAADLARMARLQKTYGARGLSVVNINSWDSVPAMRTASFGSTRAYDQVYDPAVANQSVAIGLYHAPDLPATFVVDRDGLLRARFVRSDRGAQAALVGTLRTLGVAP